MRGIARRSAITLGFDLAGDPLRPARAQEPPAWPSRTVRLLVGFAPGGSLDFAARAVAERLTQRLGQSFAVENRAAATGNIAAEAVASAAPPRDGHLLLMGNVQNIAVNAALQRDLAFDPARDLLPLAQVATVPYVLVVPAELPVRSMAELIALARREPGRLNAGTPGIGSLQHLALELLKARAGALDITHVPFRGGSEVARDLIGGRLQIGIDTLVRFGPGIEAGHIRPLATLHTERLPGRPGLPTIAETPGLEGVEAAGWIGIAGPSGMPFPALALLEAATAWAMRETDLPARMDTQGLLARFADAEAFGALVAGERERWARVVRAAGITLAERQGAAARSSQNARETAGIYDRSGSKAVVRQH
ncbi:Bug family tripartite tricarboxylate transporter substrate binding protein [Neoroseomonas nitratireducens]|nr:tripartite tricarboxylate transporter substrate-binding protein [Neoroseomonas nitratireducens]